MTWEVFYLICFIVGLVLSALSLLGGLGHIGHFLHIGGHVHVPHLPHGAVPHLPHGAVPHMPQGGGHLPNGMQGPHAPAAVPWWNGFSLMIFLCWFGAAGYLLTRHGSFVAMVVLVLSLIAGLTGGTIVFLFLAKVMLPHERELTSDETAVAGVVGVVSSPIRADGVGEIIYEQMGARRSAPARSEDGVAIPKQEEVYVVRYEKGVAWVRRWEDANSEQ
jgi:membrane protein implicated in regulation of membrane protease activity